MAKRVFVSHISDEAKIAGHLKAALVQDFLGFLDVFVSSDSESIAATGTRSLRNKVTPGRNTISRSCLSKVKAFRATLP